MRPISDGNLLRIFGAAEGSFAFQWLLCFRALLLKAPLRCNRDDPDANAKFQALGEAYQVLSDVEMREKYDKGGEEMLDEHNFMDSGDLFAMIFGSDKFDALVGELALASAMEEGL